MTAADTASDPTPRTGIDRPRIKVQLVAARSATFRVLGIPHPQGSKSAFVANGKARMRESSGRGFAAWRNAVAEAALHEAERLGAPLDGPLRLSVAFRFPMPASRPARIRRMYSVPKTTAPDLSKLIRAVEDALQAAGLIADDARIVQLDASKTEMSSSWTGALITITDEVSS